MLFQSDGIEIPRNRIPFHFGVFELRAPHLFAFEPAQPFDSSWVRHRSAIKLLSQRIRQPHARFLIELCAKPKSVLSMLQAHRLVRSGAKRELRPGSGPTLIRQLRRLQPNRFIELCKEALRVLNLIDGRTLVRDQSLAFNQKLILLRLTAEDGMVFNDQAFHSRAGATVEEQCSSKPANSTTNDYAVINLPGIDDVVGELIVHVVTNRMTRFENGQSVAIRIAIVADSAVTREVIFLRQ